MDEGGALSEAAGHLSLLVAPQGCVLVGWVSAMSVSSPNPMAASHQLHPAPGADLSMDAWFPMNAPHK